MTISVSDLQLNVTQTPIDVPGRLYPLTWQFDTLTAPLTTAFDGVRRWIPFEHDILKSTVSVNQGGTHDLLAQSVSMVRYGNISTSWDLASHTIPQMCYRHYSEKDIETNETIYRGQLMSPRIAANTATGPNRCYGVNFTLPYPYSSTGSSDWTGVTVQMWYRPWNDRLFELSWDIPDFTHEAPLSGFVNGFRAVPFDCTLLGVSWVSEIHGMGTTGDFSCGFTVWTGTEGADAPATLLRAMPFGASVENMTYRYHYPYWYPYSDTTYPSDTIAAGTILGLKADIPSATGYINKASFSIWLQRP